MLTRPLARSLVNPAFGDLWARPPVEAIRSNCICAQWQRNVLEVFLSQINESVLRKITRLTQTIETDIAHLLFVQASFISRAL
jgi:hypothetical protein